MAEQAIGLGLGEGGREQAEGGGLEGVGGVEPGSIGWAASSGCFRMFNQDVADLAARVRPGAKVVVR